MTTTVGHRLPSAQPQEVGTDERGRNDAETARWSADEQLQRSALQAEKRGIWGSGLDEIAGNWENAPNIALDAVGRAGLLDADVAERGPILARLLAPRLIPRGRTQDHSEVLGCFLFVQV